jgi:hypothetical protein
MPTSSERKSWRITDVRSIRGITHRFDFIEPLPAVGVDFDPSRSGMLRWRIESPVPFVLGYGASFDEAYRSFCALFEEQALNVIAGVDKMSAWTAKQKQEAEIYLALIETAVPLHSEPLQSGSTLYDDPSCKDFDWDDQGE